MSRTLAIALIGAALCSTQTLAADSKEKKQAQKAAPAAKATTAPTNKAADKGAQGGIILQNNQKASNKGAQGGIILQNNAGKSTNMKAPANKTAAPGG
jgi:ATPase subunit of ABC transporter with duplicated ATPase domains